MTEYQRQSKAYADVKARLWGCPSVKNLIADQRAFEREEEIRRRKEAERLAEIEARIEEARREKDRKARRRAAEITRAKNVLAKLATKQGVAETLDSVQAQIPKIIENTRPSMETIASAVLDKYPGVTIEEVRSASRTRKIVMARREIVVRIRQIRPEISYPRIGDFLCKDHTSCVHAWQQWERQHEK
jgi:chromosomal replication initiation ATPase DnaA